jgi:hypothetical protein
MFKQEMISNDGVVFNKKVIELPATPSSSKKAFQRLAIENEVFDIHDSLADTTKWLSLLSSVVARMYAILPESQKAQIPAQERAVIEYAIQKFNDSTTRADIQFALEGNQMIDKIFDRQTQLSSIIK